MSLPSPPERVEVVRRQFFYGWVIVAVCTLMIGIAYGLMYSYSVFFKPLTEYFNWDRATVSAVYSVSLIIRGAVAIGIGWLADRYGAIKLVAFCGFMLGLGLVLSSRVKELWQLYLTYGLIEAIGLSGAFGIGTAMVSRWFTENRGLALGIMSTGSGLGTLLIVPVSGRLVNALGWSQTFLVYGVTAGVVMMALAFLLRPAPRPALAAGKEPAFTVGDTAAPQADIALGRVIKDSRMILFMGAVLLFFFSIQIIMVHLVTYATDVGINPLVAATFISVIGAVSIAGRLLTGIGTDKTGIFNTLILTRIFLVVSFVCLLFTRSLWSFYLFAVIFGFPYGGEIPQVPLFIGKYWGTKSMATLVGLNLFVITIGGALGAWGAGKIYDAAHSYRGAFIAGGIAGLVSLILILILRRQTSRHY
jgi:OFA family oxalate/formate antiporter-like MFS transporter